MKTQLVAQLIRHSRFKSWRSGVNLFQFFVLYDFEFSDFKGALSLAKAIIVPPNKVPRTRNDT